MHLDLFENILPLSIAKTPEEIIHEWNFVDSYMSSDIDNCICGHEIREICLIKNKHNNDVIKVGNCCIRYFKEKTVKNIEKFSYVGKLRRANSRKVYRDIFDLIATLPKTTIVLFIDIKSTSDPELGIAVMTQFEDLDKSTMGTTYRRLAKLKELDLIRKVIPFEIPNEHLSMLKANPAIPEKYSYMINPYLLKPWQYELAKQIWELIDPEKVKD